MFETIRYDVADNIATITLNRPDRLNAFTKDMARELQDVFGLTDADDNVRAVVMTGEGRGFCAGADLGSGGDTFDYAKSGHDAPIRADGTIDWGHEMVRDNGGKVSLRIYDSLKPVIGAINGPAVGIGLTMTLPMDIRLASENAKMGFVFAKRGIVPEAASSWFLPRLVGISQAVEWVTTGRVFGAQEALAGGLVRSVHAADDLLPAAYALAREIAESAPVSAVLARKMMWQGLSMKVPMEAHRIDSRGVYSRGRSGDAKEGVMSFLEKRAPDYPCRVSKDMPEWFPWWETAEWE
jgi:enoyl-CoA hydratase/carnithine racemase